MESYTVIIAEDDPWIAKIITLYCEKCNLNVVFFTDSGLELIDACNRYRPDIVLLDSGLNDLDGISAIQAINQYDFFPQIVIISGSQSFSDAFNSINAVNPIYFLSKPVQMHIFETAIQKTIAKIESQKNITAAPSEKHWIKDAYDAAEGSKEKVVNLFGRIEIDNLIFEIYNTGIPIPNDHLDKIFTVGFTTKSSRGGSGLGLNIVNNLVKQYKGSINIVSNQQGTTFSLVIPLSIFNYRGE